MTMTNNIKYALMAVAVLVSATAGAQTEKDKKDLNKVITLEREFDPVKKEVVKKTVLPKEIKQSTKEAVAPQFSDWTAPALVPVDIPTMLPYGYRTLHNFSNQRGYLDIGMGTCLNTMVNAGYRIKETDTEKLGLWLQHNSTWLGKNTSKLIEQPSQRQKQRFNDNLLGVGWSKELSKGTLGIDGRLHFDSFNFYGGFSDYLKNNKTAFVEARVDGKWESKYNINDEDAIEYEANATIDYAGYDKSHLEGISGAKEFWLHGSIEGEYNLEKIGHVGLLFGGDVINLRRHDVRTNDANDKTYGMLTLNPYYKYSNDIFTAKAGAIVNFSFNDGTAVRIAPDVDLNFKIYKGVNLFVLATGGKEINHLGAMHDVYRYNDPLAGYGNTYYPFDGRIGFNVGPFVGFSAKAYVGYGFMTGQLDAVVPAANSGIYKEVLDEENPMPDGPNSPYKDFNQYAAVIYKMTKCKGAYMGIEMNYKYRSLAEAKLQFIHSFAGDEDYVDGMRYTGYPLGDDGPTSLFNFDVKVWPIKPLMVTAGIACRFNRSALTREWVYPTYDEEGFMINDGYYRFGAIEMKDIIDLHVGARYSFSHIFSVWAQANNLLCKQWDIMPGQGAQKIGIVGGISLNF